MTKADKELLLKLVTRPAMYVHPLEAASVINFIHGYEVGTGNKCNFTELIRYLLSKKYNAGYSSDGWSGQIKRLAAKRHSTWLITFQKVTLELLATAEEGNSDNWQQELQEFLRQRIIHGLLNRIVTTGHPWFGASWVEDWLVLCAVKSGWFKLLWTRREWNVIKAIDKLVQTGSIFRDEEQRLPSPALLALKSAYDKAAGSPKALE